jgi:branched-chain amino acid transport system permease protein
MHQTIAAAQRAAPEPVLAGLPLKTWRTALLAVTLLVALALPFFVKNFYVFQITMAMIYGIAILGLNLLTGINGQFSLGHSAFFGLGAYTTAVMMEHMGVSF